jgi:hypothetical protein
LVAKDGNVDTEISSLAAKDSSLDTDVSSLSVILNTNNIFSSSKELTINTRSIEVDWSDTYQPSTVPSVVGMIRSSNAGDPIIAANLSGTATTGSATFVFSGPISSNYYKLDVMAVNPDESFTTVVTDEIQESNISSLASINSDIATDVSSLDTNVSSLSVVTSTVQTSNSTDVSSLAAKDTSLDTDISSLAAASTGSIGSTDVSSLAAKDTSLDTDISSLAAASTGSVGSTDVSSLAAKDTSLDTDISSLSYAMIQWDSSVPTGVNSAGSAGDIVYDSNYMYVCVSANTWKRMVLGEWS